MNISKTVILLLLSLLAVYCKRNEPKQKSLPPPALSETGIVTEFEYDDHPNPFYQFGVYINGHISPVHLSPNNILKSTYTSKDGSVLIASYHYEYDANGYPRKMTASFITRKTGSGIRQTTKIAY